MADFKPWYRNYTLGVLAFGYMLNSFDRSILGILLEPIKLEFSISDVSLGLLSGIAFAAFYSTLGIPIASWADRSNRRNILALAIFTWSTMTLFCGFASSFLLLLLARIGTAIGEAGGSPPSHSLISDYFSASRRGTALSIFALGAPAGAVLSGLLGGVGNEVFGWRTTLVLAGVPGLLLAPLVLFTVAEPRSTAVAAIKTHSLPLREVTAFLWQRRSFRHLCIASALHSLVIYGTTTFNAPFLMRSHQWGTADVGKLVALSGAFGIAGTFLGGLLADRCSVRWSDQRWYLWICALATLLMVPFELLAYLGAQSAVVIVALVASGCLGMVFFGPVYATAQALAPSRMRAVASSMLIFVKTMIGLGIGPLLIGWISDLLLPVAGIHSLRYALLVSVVFNLWAAVHFCIGARHLREDLAAHHKSEAMSHDESLIPATAVHNPQTTTRAWT